MHDSYLHTPGSVHWAAILLVWSMGGYWITHGYICSNYNWKLCYERHYFSTAVYFLAPLKPWPVDMPVLCGRWMSQGVNIESVALLRIVRDSYLPIQSSCPHWYICVQLSDHLQIKPKQIQLKMMVTKYFKPNVILSSSLEIISQ